MSTFEFPWQYRFPPFFTLQPHEETREKQLEAWQSLIVSFAKHNGIDRLVVAECPQMALFNNKAINRSLDQDSILAVLSHLEQTGHVEWLSKEKTECALFYQSPLEWATVIYKWAVDMGQTETPLTIFELLEGETGEGADFYGIDRFVFLKAIAHLEKDGKAEAFGIEEGEEATGVKFFVV